MAKPSAAPRAVRDLAKLQKTASAPTRGEPGQAVQVTARAHLQGDVTATNSALALRWTDPN